MQGTLVALADLSLCRLLAENSVGRADAGCSQAPLLVARDLMSKSIGSAQFPKSRIFSRCRDNRLDFAADESVHAEDRGGVGLTSGGSEAPVGSCRRGSGQ
jgi:hypothetical protein